MFATVDPPSFDLPRAPHTIATGRADDRDARLLAAVANRGDSDAFEQLYARHIAAVINAALQVCRNHAIAEDIAQQTFKALWERAERLVSKTVRVRPWLTTVARNAAIDELRSRSASAAPLCEECDRPTSDGEPEREALIAEATDELHAALRTLSAPQRDAVDMIYFHGMSYAAASRAAGVPSATLKSRIRLALAHLRAALEENYHG
jgi:RNA polymerase sigma-70 factor (ECF subfamily)